MVTKIVKYKQLLENFTYLSFLHVFGLLTPFVTFPYLIKVLGKETYGLVIFAQAITSYLAVFVNFGFDLYATKEISIFRENEEKLSEIVSSVFVIKGILCAISFLFLWLIMIFVEAASNEKWLFIFSMFICINEWIFPKWYFQGTEKMKYITMLNVLSRVVAVGLIFLLVKEKSNFIIVPLLYGLGALIGGFYAFWIIFSKLGTRFRWQSFSTLKSYTIQSFPLFISSFSVQIYTHTNKIIVGNFLGMTEVAYYNIAEKIVDLLKAPQMLIIRTIYPKLSQSGNNHFAKKMLKISVIITISIFIGTILGADYIILFLEYLTSKTFPSAANIIRVLVFVVPIIGLNSYYGAKIFIQDEHRRKFMWVIVAAALIYFLLLGLFYAASALTIYSIPLITVLVEVYIVICTYILVRKYDLFK